MSHSSQALSEAIFHFLRERTFFAALIILFSEGAQAVCFGIVGLQSFVAQPSTFVP